MGIPFFNSWVRRRVKEAIIAALPPIVSSLSIDLNALIHEVAANIFPTDPIPERMRTPLLDEARFQLAFEARLRDIIKRVGPREHLILATDGVPPWAKMKDQRQRRFRAALGQVEGVFNRSSNISPGTDFMRRFDLFLQGWISIQQGNYPFSIIYGSDMVPGEGEHKIMDFYRASVRPGSDLLVKDGIHVIYGLDADLIMLSLISPMKHLFCYQYREEKKEFIRSSYGAPTSEGHADILNVETLRVYLRDSAMGGRASALDDFVVMMFLHGNDFLYHPPSIADIGERKEEVKTSEGISYTRAVQEEPEIKGSVDIFFDIYATLNRPLTVVTATGTAAAASYGAATAPYGAATAPYGAAASAPYGSGLPPLREIDWVAYGLFLTELAKYEPLLLEKAAQRHQRRPFKYPPTVLLSSIQRDGKIAMPVYRAKWYALEWAYHRPSPIVPALEATTGQPMAYTSLPAESEVRGQNVVDMVGHQMRMMAWTYLYYQRGTDAVNSNICYPYHHAALVVDMASVINQSPMIDGYTFDPKAIRLTVIHQQVAIFPRQAADVVADLPGLRDLLVSPRSELLDYYPDAFVIEREGKDFVNQGISLIPIPDPYRIFDAVASLVFDFQQIAPYHERKYLYLKKSTGELEASQAKRVALAAIRPARALGYGGGRGEGRGRDSRGGRGASGGRGGRGGRGESGGWGERRGRGGMRGRGRG